ncbi:hypothetical protein B0H15DRAFT_866195 [Mycena belliarum]|uniref:MYND-type domain-containing protein n=1 Tax=Mycena belliarum TaxID=1033014 RepID=A0AAD6TRY4_9AGAR|nr:hypothetical protein B0H15DRAFT_866195 [Mycena belliae]
MDSMMNPTAHSLVSWVGLMDEDGAPPDPVNDLRGLKAQLGILQAAPISKQMKIYSETTATYMPALAAIFRQTPEVLGCISVLLNAISSSPYFVRFLRSPGGAGIAALQAKRVANAVNEIPSMSVDDAAEICQFLSTLLLLQGVQDVAEEDKTILLKHLPIWERIFSGRLAAKTANRCLAQLTDDPAMREMTRAVKTMLESKLEQCGGPGCTRRISEDGSKSALMHCSRCKTAVYCGAAHQKAAWAEHKRICFAPAF